PNHTVYVFHRSANGAVWEYQHNHTYGVSNAVDMIGKVVTYTSPDTLDLSAVTSTCGITTTTFTVLVDGSPTTSDLSGSMSATWNDASTTTNVVSYVSGNTYSVAVMAPTTEGTYTLSVKHSTTTLLSDTTTVSMVLNVANSAATFSLPAYNIVSDGTIGPGDFEFDCFPKDDCNNTMTSKDVIYTICKDSGATCIVGDEPFKLTNAGGYGVWEYIMAEGVWTYTATVDGTEIKAQSIDIAPTFATVGTDTVGVSASLSTLTGLPTSTDEAYISSLVIKDLYDANVEADLSPVVTWDGSVVTATWVPATNSYTISGTAASSAESYAITVTVNSVEIVSEAVATTYGITTSLDLSVEHTCQTETVTFTLIKNGATYTTDMSSLLTAKWDNTTPAPIAYSPTDSTYSLGVTVPSGSGTHILVLYLDGGIIASDTASYYDGYDQSSSSMNLASPLALLDATFTVTMDLRDYCGSVYEIMDAEVTVTDGTHSDTQTARSGNSYAVDFDFGFEGVYTITSVGIVNDQAVAKDETNPTLFTESISIAPVVYMDSVAVSAQLNTLTGLPTETQQGYTATLTIKDVSGDAIFEDMSPVVMFGDTVMVADAVPGTGSYTITGTSGSDEAEFDATVTLSGVTILTAPVSLVAPPFPWMIVIIAAAVVCAIVAGLTVYCCCIRSKGDAKTDATVNAMEGGVTPVGMVGMPVVQQVPVE
ncbi:hypothetical protein KIPB_010842, partial [Kipferlia bialata]